jgi:hypothetical protein
MLNKVCQELSKTVFGVLRENGAECALRRRIHSLTACLGIFFEERWSVREGKKLEIQGFPSKVVLNPRSIALEAYR